MDKSAESLIIGNFYKVFTNNYWYYFRVSSVINKFHFTADYYSDKGLYNNNAMITNNAFWRECIDSSYQEFKDNYKGSIPLAGHIKPPINPLLIF